MLKKCRVVLDHVLVWQQTLLAGISNLVLFSAKGSKCYGIFRLFLRAREKKMGLPRGIDSAICFVVSAATTLILPKNIFERREGGDDTQSDERAEGEIRRVAWACYCRTAD